jgi:hypothetical protein
MPDHPEPGIAHMHIAEALGTRDFDFLNGLLNHAMSDHAAKRSMRRGLNFMLSIVKGIEPRDQMEGVTGCTNGRRSSSEHDHSKKWSWLKAWAMQIARRRGMKKAIVALARAVIMHRIWVDGTEFRWTREQATAKRTPRIVSWHCVYRKPKRGGW